MKELKKEEKLLYSQVCEDINIVILDYRKISVQIEQNVLLPL